MKHIDLATSGWPDYELLDSGENKKLERFGPFVLIRPETQAIWRPLHPELWKTAKAEFRFDGGKGSGTRRATAERKSGISRGITMHALRYA